MDERTDHELIYAAQAGDRQAFSVLVERHYRMMFKVAWKWCGVTEDAEDIAQDAAIKLGQNIGSFRFESAFTTWLYRLVMNAAKDRARVDNRKNLRETPLYEDAQFAAATPSPEQQLAHKDALRFLEELPEDMKDTVIFVCWQGLTHKEAAQVLDCSEGTVSWRMH